MSVCLGFFDVKCIEWYQKKFLKKWISTIYIGDFDGTQRAGCRRKEKASGGRRKLSWGSGEGVAEAGCRGGRKLVVGVMYRKSWAHGVSCDLSTQLAPYWRTKRCILRPFSRTGTRPTIGLGPRMPSTRPWLPCRRPSTSRSCPRSMRRPLRPQM